MLMDTNRAGIKTRIHIDTEKERHPPSHALEGLLLSYKSCGRSCCCCGCFSSSFASYLVSGHFVEGLLQLDADFLVLLLPLVELLHQGVQLLLQLGGFALGGGRLDLGEFQIQRQISDFLLALLVALEG